MNGGSGISIYGMNENNKAILRDNIITGNLWGITVINAADVNMGTEDDWGNNHIHDNGNDGSVYDLYNNSTINIMAVGNDWGTSDRRLIEAHIVHQNDDPSLGLVTFIPFIDIDSVDESNTLAFEISPNPVLESSFILTLKENVPSEMVIYNLNGQIVKSQHIENQVNRIDIQSLEKGIYLIEVRSSENKWIKKRIIII